MRLITSEDATKHFRLQKNDVWGNYKKGTEGLIIAQGYPDKAAICPIFKDKIPYKSVTVVCKQTDIHEVGYWLDYVLGGNSVSFTKKLPNGQVAIRADYKCW